MAHWLLKSEPTIWSWDDQVKAGAKGTAWDGIRNHLAKKHLMAMQRGERAFFYHSGDDKEIIGVVEVIGEYRPDPGDKTATFGMVDVKAVRALPVPVTLARCKAERKLAGMALLNNSRLSVQPVTEAEWAVVCRISGMRPD
jgi:predicted RNA-binding protein with PUA-like domain